jgi:hypothetical protein
MNFCTAVLLGVVVDLLLALVVARLCGINNLEDDQ